MLLVVGMTTLVVLAFAVPVGILLHSAVAQRVEHATIDQANYVALLLRSGGKTTAQITSDVTSLSSSTGRPTSVVLPDHTVVGAQLPADVPPPAGNGHPADDTHGGGGPGPGGNPQATLHSVPGGQLAEVSVPADNGTDLVRVFVSNSALYAGEGTWRVLLIGGSVGLLLIGVLAAELLTRRIVRPLTRTAQTAHQLSVGGTAARAPTDGPREIAEVGTALNRLADRIDELIAEERETVADLSHRLRTPLTALRLDAEALHDPVEAERVATHVSAVERTLTAVIHAARRPQREGRLPSCDATAIVGERVRFWSALAEDQSRTSTVELPESPLLVRASGDDLGAAVDALVENVIAHTPEGVPFAVRLTATEGGAQLVVSDEGPGLPADALVRGRSDRGSSGLGLDIARRCAESGGGSMTMDSGPTGGAVITLLLRAP
ncbi:MAG: Signal transduction histidine kinase [Pseudonocardiales bacterium]|nr:Signal transduction histidine kinase [Pseudonocardiales bacterium]